MNTGLVLKNVSKHIALTNEEEAHFLSLLKFKSVSKKEFILEEGKICNTFNFVCSGTLRAYYLSNSAKDSTVMFAISDWWITDMACFAGQKPAMLNIVAVEKSEILQLSKNDFDKLLIEIPKFEKFFRIIMQNAYIREQLRVLENLSLPAEEQYQNFLEKYPQIVSQVTQKQIASYLGITPEFISMLRRKKSKN